MTTINIVGNSPGSIGLFSTAPTHATFSGDFASGQLKIFAFQTDPNAIGDINSYVYRDNAVFGYRTFHISRNIHVALDLNDGVSLFYAVIGGDARFNVTAEFFGGDSVEQMTLDSDPMFLDGDPMFLV